MQEKLFMMSLGSWDSKSRVVIIPIQLCFGYISCIVVSSNRKKEEKEREKLHLENTVFEI